jgi:hypothetical protein
MEQSDSEKKQPSRKKITKKKKTHSTGLSASNVSAPVPSAITELIRDAFLRFQDTTDIKQSKYQDLEHMNSIIEEFLSTFMILGYDLNGEKVFIMHAKSHQDKDALIEHLRTTLLNLVNKDNSQ